VGVTLVVAVVGPTATGKSDLGLALAEALGGEVVNADAMQLYRGMDIGTAKLAPDERRGVPHHQLDVLEVEEEASVSAYQRHARADVAAVHGRGRRAVVVGGSGLYVRALLDRLEMPPTDPEVRARLEERAEREGPGALHVRLAELDPDAAARITPGDVRRIVRALEVIELTGRPFSATLPAYEYALPAVQIGLDCDRAELDARITARAERMWDGGLLDETAGLAARMGRTARAAVGYAQALAVLAGELDEAEAREGTATATRRLARRQMTWFGRDPRVHWLPAGAPDLAERALALVEAADAGRLPAPPARRRTLGS
jgi:tRNA dimethylallyltransferase